MNTINYNPDTHAVVPKEPTEDMLNYNPRMLHPKIAGAIWEAMIAAAPELPPGQQDGCSHPFRTGTSIEVARGGGVCSTCGADLAIPPVVQQGELSKRLREHDDPRLYREADLLMHEAANEIDRLAASAGQESEHDGFTCKEIAQRFADLVEENARLVAAKASPQPQQGALAQWAALTEPSDSEWSKGYDAARSYVRMQLDATPSAAVDAESVRDAALVEALKECEAIRESGCEARQGAIECCEAIGQLRATKGASHG